MIANPSPLGLFAIACAASSAAILVVYLIRRPRLVGATKVWLLLGLGIFPVGTALAGNIVGFEETKKRTFCGSCHVMTAHTFDSDDPKSVTLSSRHGRNKLFGGENCYVCHADYGIYGTVVTKMGGMGHVWNYYLGGYHSISMDEAKRTIHIKKPYPNENCMQCHSTTTELWMKTSDHRASLDDVRSDRVSCASGGCHGLAHPYWQTTK